MTLCVKHVKLWRLKANENVAGRPQGSAPLIPSPPHPLIPSPAPQWQSGPAGGVVPGCGPPRSGTHPIAFAIFLVMSHGARTRTDSFVSSAPMEHKGMIQWARDHGIGTIWAMDQGYRPGTRAMGQGQGQVSDFRSQVSDFPSQVSDFPDFPFPKPSFRFHMPSFRFSKLSFRFSKPSFRFCFRFSIYPAKFPISQAKFPIFQAKFPIVQAKFPIFQISMDFDEISRNLRPDQ